MVNLVKLNKHSLARTAACIAASGCAIAATTVPFADATRDPNGRGAGFSVLERPAMPADDVTRWAPRADPAVGARFAEARVVHRDAGRVVAAVPARNGACLLSRLPDGSRAMSCGGDADHFPATVGYAGAIGLVPDAVRAVTFTMTDGSVRTAEVIGNVWRSPVEAATAAYAVGGRVHRVGLMPRSSLPAGARLSPSGVVSGGAAPAGFGD